MASFSTISIQYKKPSIYTAKKNFREALIIIMITHSIVLELVNLSRANKERESPMMLSYQAMLRPPAAAPIKTQIC